MRLFSSAQADKINRVAERTKDSIQAPKKVSAKNISSELERISKQVLEYFKDSEAILIESREQLHDYVTKLIESGYAGIDTETTGLDRIHDTIVGSSLYYPGGVECYIPNKHLVPIFDQPYKGQLTYKDVQEEFQRIVDSDVKLIFANADFDLAMIYKDYKIDFVKNFYYDVIIGWRVIREGELHYDLKGIYNRHVLKGSGDPKKFSDFFSPQLFPYCKPQIAKLYAAHDAKITFEEFTWQLPYITKTNSKCIKNHLERISDLVWSVEMPMVRVCQQLHRNGIYLDKEVAKSLQAKYHLQRDQEMKVLQDMVQKLIDERGYTVSSSVNKPFKTGLEFNPTSPLHVKYLLYTLMNIQPTGKKEGTGKEVLNELNLPITNQILKVRSLGVLINTFVDKMPKIVGPDGRIHATFKQVGADTGRMSSADPNLQNIPSHATDIRHMFRASPGYVMMSSDYSQQEPKLTAFVSQDQKMFDAFTHGKDIYATIASIGFNVPYESCLEFHPETHEYQPDGKARRGEAKTVLLGVLYGRSIPSIAEQLYGKRTDMSDDQKVKSAQKVYDSIMNGFPSLRNAMLSAQNHAKVYGYTETILGRRRHLPDMQLPEFEFKAMPGYVNPDIDPLDISTLDQREDIPKRIKHELLKEFCNYKYFGQIVKRTKQLAEEHIRVINNRPKINDATRQCLNGVIQGSAADMTKLALLNIYESEEWKKLGGRILIPIHDEILCEFPKETYKEGAKLLSKLMSDAGSFLPFPINCDVEVTVNWYGLEYPCPYTEPESLDTVEEDEIKWIQYMLFECEYSLPKHKEMFGEEFRGDIAKGVDGVYSDEIKLMIEDYKSKWRIESDEDFIKMIKTHVIDGITPYDQMHELNSESL